MTWEIHNGDKILIYYIVMDRISTSASSEHPHVFDIQMRNMSSCFHLQTLPHVEDANIMRMFNANVKQLHLINDKH